VIIGVSGYFVYITYIKKQKVNSALQAIPEHSFIVVQTNDLFKAYDKISNSELWQYLIKTDYFKDINQDLTSLDQYLRATPLPKSFFQNRPLILSINVVNDSWDYLVVIDMKDLGKMFGQLDFLLNSIPDYKTFKLNYNLDDNHKYLIYKIVYLKNQYEKYFITIADNLLIISPKLSLVKSSLYSLNNSSLIDKPAYKEVLTKLHSSGLFSVIINFKQLDAFVRTFQNKRDPYIYTLSQGLDLGLMYMDVEQTSIILKGLVKLDTLNPYFNALKQNSPSIFGSYQIITDQTAAIVSLNFSNYKDFYNSFMQAYKRQDPKTVYEIEKSINVLKKVVGIDIEEDIFSWIGNEIAIYKLSPEFGKRAQDVIITIHTHNPILAFDKLEKLTKKIKNLSPIKFKTIDYRGYKIKFLEIKGFFRMFFGSLFATIDKPYFTIIGNYVVFSNSTQTLEKVIDDFLSGLTLSADNKFVDFMDNFSRKNTFFAYINTPLLFKNILFYASAKDKQELLANKDLIIAFNQLALQLAINKDLMKINIVSDYDPDVKIDLIIKQLEKQTNIEQLLADIDSLKLKIHLTDTNLNDGLFIAYYPETKHIYLQGEVKNNKPVGQWKVFYPSGNLKMLQMFNFKGNLDGLVQIFYDNKPNSKLAEFYIRDDKIYGTLIQYYENGQVKAKIEYKDGLRNGQAIFYYPNGKIQVKGHYLNGKKHGRWKFYDKQENLINTEVWKHDIRKR